MICRSILIGCIILLAITLYSMCVLSGRISREEENDLHKRTT